jgi:hypothetical protein
MKHYIAIILLFLAPMLRLYPAIGADPVPEAASGKVLILDQDRIMEGDIDRVGDRYRIRRPSGETWIRAKDTIGLVADREAAYQFLRTRCDEKNVTDRVRLARWCQAHGLRKQALAEADAAVLLQPQDKALSRFREELMLAPESPAMQPLAPKPPDPILPDPGNAEVSPESLSLFVAKVQPILMNLCATCHAAGRGGDYKLTRTYGNTAIGQRATRANLISSSAFLNRAQPDSSVLLVKAVTAHGDATAPPIRDRQVPAYKHLDDWVRLALDQPLQGPEKPTVAPTTTGASALKLPPTLTSSQFGSDAEMPVQIASTRDGKPPVAKPEKPPVMPVTVPEKPKTIPGDPFDPSIFNRQMFPNKNP